MTTLPAPYDNQQDTLARLRACSTEKPELFALLAGELARQLEQAWIAEQVTGLLISVENGQRPDAIARRLRSLADRCAATGEQAVDA